MINITSFLCFTRVGGELEKYFEIAIILEAEDVRQDVLNAAK